MQLGDKSPVIDISHAGRIVPVPGDEDPNRDAAAASISVKSHGVPRPRVRMFAQRHQPGEATIGGEVAMRSAISRAGLGGCRRSSQLRMRRVAVVAGSLKARLKTPAASPMSITIDSEVSVWRHSVGSTTYVACKF